jgi:hypothetical protein
MKELMTIEEVSQFVEQMDVEFGDLVRSGEMNDPLEECKAHEYGSGLYYRIEVERVFTWLIESRK